MTHKVKLASREWLELAEEHLSELVARSGNDGYEFSMCEVFLNAPPGLIGQNSGRTAWHFRISGAQAKAEEGEVDDVDLKYILDYKEAEQLARIVLAPGDEGAGQASSLEVEGNSDKTPPYLRELHNFLAPLTL